MGVEGLRVLLELVVVVADIAAAVQLVQAVVVLWAVRLPAFERRRFAAVAVAAHLARQKHSDQALVRYFAAACLVDLVALRDYVRSHSLRRLCLVE